MRIFTLNTMWQYHIHYGVDDKNCTQWVVLQKWNVPRAQISFPGAFDYIWQSLYNQYLAMVLTWLNVSIARCQKDVMFWMWCHRGAALWRHGCGAWHNGLFQTTASNFNCSVDVTNHVTQLLQAGDTENFTNARSRAIYGLYHGLELPNHGITYEDDVSRTISRLIGQKSMSNRSLKFLGLCVPWLGGYLTDYFQMWQ